MKQFAHIQQALALELKNVLISKRDENIDTIIELQKEHGLMTRQRKHLVIEQIDSRMKELNEENKSIDFQISFLITPRIYFNNNSLPVF